MHAGDEVAFGLLGAEEMAEERAGHSESLLPAVRAFPHGVFKVPPERVEGAIRIEDVSGERIRASPAEIDVCDREVAVTCLTFFRKLERYAGIEQSSQGVRTEL